MRHGLPLAVIEAKRTSVNVEKGRQQAVLYADFLSLCNLTEGKEEANARAVFSTYQTIRAKKIPRNNSANHFVPEYNTMMTHGQRVDFGEKIGKAIIFAKNHNHAEKILEMWNGEYPDYPAHYARVIDNYTKLCSELD